MDIFSLKNFICLPGAGMMKIFFLYAYVSRPVLQVVQLAFMYWTSWWFMQC